MTKLTKPEHFLGKTRTIAQAMFHHADTLIADPESVECGEHHITPRKARFIKSPPLERLEHKKAGGTAHRQEV